MKVMTYVISLEYESKRRESIAHELNKRGLDFKFYNAIDLKNKSQSEADYYIEHDAAFNKPPRKLTKGEIGCTLSHINLLRKLSHDQQSQRYLILEDDAQITDDLYGFLYADKLNKFDWDIIILGYSKLKESDFKYFYIKEPIKIISIVNNIRIGYVWREWTCGTVGYLVNPNCLYKFQTLPITTLADDWNYLKNKLNLVIYHVRPLLIKEDFLHFPSAIENERVNLLKKNRSFIDLYRYFRGMVRAIIFFLEKHRINFIVKIRR